MLTSDLAMSWRRGRATGPKSINVNDPAYLQVAEGLIRIVREHENHARAALDLALEEYIGTGTDYKILRGLIKLILDRCAFEIVSSRDPLEIRRALFLKARSHHPVSQDQKSRQAVLADAASELECNPSELLEGLYADLPENQRLTGFEELGASELLDRYNLAQAQAMLYRSVEMRLKVEPQPSAGYRQLFDAIKAYRLIHTIRGSEASGYEIRLSGPVSMFHRSQKYGVQMAVFLPALLACRGWTMRAEIDLKFGGTAFFELDSRQTELRSYHLSEDANENPLTDKLIAKWEAAGAGWTAEISREVIGLGASAFIPDLVFTCAGGRKVYLEVLGFWTPRYLADRLKDFEDAGYKNFILAVSNELRGSREAPPRLPPNVVEFKSVLDATAIKATLDFLARDEV